MNDGVTFAHYSVKEYLERIQHESSIIIGYPALMGEDLRCLLLSLTLTESNRLDEDEIMSVLSSVPEKNVFYNETSIDGAQKNGYDQLVRFHCANFQVFSIWLAICSLDYLHDSMCNDEELRPLAIDFLDPSKPYSPIYESFMSALEWHQNISGFSYGKEFISWHWTLISDAKTENDMKHFANLIFMAPFDLEGFSLAKSFLYRKDRRILLQTRMCFSIKLKHTFDDGWTTFRGSYIEVLAQLAFMFLDIFEYVMEIGAGLFDPSNILMLYSGTLYNDGKANKGARVMKRLLELGADPNLKGYQTTPLQIASSAGNFVGVEELLRAGAQPNGTGTPGGIAWGDQGLLIWKIRSLQAASPLWVCRRLRIGWLSTDDRDGNYSKVENLLLSYGATAVAGEGHLEVVNRSLQGGACPDNAVEELDESILRLDTGSSSSPASRTTIPSRPEQARPPSLSSLSPAPGSSDEEMVESDSEEETTVRKVKLHTTTFEDRIFRPVEYFGDLEGLSRRIRKHSTLPLYAQIPLEPERVLYKVTSSFPDQLTSDLYSPWTEEHYLKICEQLPMEHKAILFEFLDCRNVSLQALSNLMDLKRYEFCQHFISLLAYDRNRSDVVKLINVSHQEIEDVVKELQVALKELTARFEGQGRDLARDQGTPESPRQVMESLRVEECRKFINKLGYDQSLELNGIMSGTCLLVRLVVSVLDLAVVNYTGAHLDSLPLIEDSNTLDILEPFRVIHRTEARPLFLQRCHLNCLDQFHNGQPIWAFSFSAQAMVSGLYLSTTADTFADIWGPMWRVSEKKDSDVCTRYAVGDGYIDRWERDLSDVLLAKDEIFCHWTPRDEFFRGGSEEAKRTHLEFRGDEILLIGAVIAGRERLQKNEDCPSSACHARNILQDQGAIRMLGTLEPHRYPDAETYQLQVGHMGSGVSIGKVYKRRSQSLKQALLEMWTTTPGFRDPRVFRDYYGIEISPCTWNAQRIQLGRILGLPCMRRYLECFPWASEKAQRVYFEALDLFCTRTNALEELWTSYSEYRGDFENAVQSSMRALSMTGISHKDLLNALLCSNATARPELVTLAPKDHTWIGMIKDNEKVCSMAVLGDDCLEFIDPEGQHSNSCNQSGCSVFRTAVLVNSMNTPCGIRKISTRHDKHPDGWRSRWTVRQANEDTDFWLGKNGNLRFQSFLPDATLLTTWRAARLATAVKNLLDIEKPHREYLEDLSAEACKTRPVPVFVKSDERSNRHIGSRD